MDFVDVDSSCLLHTDNVELYESKDFMRKQGLAHELLMISSWVVHGDWSPGSFTSGKALREVPDPMIEDLWFPHESEMR